MNNYKDNIQEVRVSIRDLNKNEFFEKSNRYPDELCRTIMTKCQSISMKIATLTVLGLCTFNVNDDGTIQSISIPAIHDCMEEFSQFKRLYNTHKKAIYGYCYEGYSYYNEGYWTRIW